MVFTWVLIYFFVFRGTKSIGKVVFVTAIFPYIMLIALLIRGCTLEGSILGIEYFLGINGKGDWSKLRMVFLIMLSSNSVGAKRDYRSIKERAQSINLNLIK